MYSNGLQLGLITGPVSEHTLMTDFGHQAETSQVNSDSD